MAVRVGILSDTHNKLTRDVIDGLQGCDYILHAGDVCRSEILDEIRNIGRLYVVKGNNDRSIDLPLSKVQKLTIEKVRILMVHNRLDAAGHLSDVDLVIFGHTHRFSTEEIDGRLWLNPGSVTRPRGGGRASYCIMEIEGSTWHLTKIELNQ